MKKTQGAFYCFQYSLLFLTCLDKILSRYYQGVPEKYCLSRSCQDVSSSPSVFKLMRDMARCIKFRFTKLLILEMTALRETNKKRNSEFNFGIIPICSWGGGDR